MTALPKELTPWAPWLGTLAPDVVEDLGGHIRRLDGWIGALARPEPNPLGAPSGYDGIDRRGPWHRLSLSEWALADEVPDEFLRRAVSHELSFLLLAHEGGRPQRHVRVLVDVGPTMLGHPRLVAAALVIVLARRAARVHLFWGPLQDTWRRAGVTAAGLDALLSTRSGCIAGIEDFRPEDATADEVWLIGSSLTPSPVTPARVVRLEVEEEVGQHETTLRVRSGGAQISLPAVAEARAKRLLTSPWSAREPSGPRPGPKPLPTKEKWYPIPTSAGLPESLQVVAGTVHVIGWRADGSGIALRMPRSPADTVPRPRLIDAFQESLIAGGWRDGGYLRVTRLADGRVRWQERTTTVPLPAVRAQTPGFGDAVRQGPNAWVRTQDGGLVAFSTTGGPATIDDPAAGCELLWMEDANVWRVCRTPTGLQLTWGFPGSERSTALPPGRPFLSWNQGIPTLAIVGPTLTHLARTRPTWDLVERVQRPAGWCDRSVPHAGPGVPISPTRFFDGDTLLGADGSALLRFPRQPLRCVVTADDQYAVITTAGGTLEVWSIATQAPLSLRYVP